MKWICRKFDVGSKSSHLDNDVFEELYDHLQESLAQNLQWDNLRIWLQSEKKRGNHVEE
jgi:hypothetical protein